MESKIILSNCLEYLRTVPDNTFDSCVTDPPYGIKYLGHKWDHDVPSVELWSEVYRVLKPGAHCLSFFGTKTYHRGACRIEDAGFEIHDMVAWVHSQGMPKHKSSLKPAIEPIVFSRKRTQKRALLRIDDCRNEIERYPANVAHDGDECTVRAFGHNHRHGEKMHVKGKTGQGTFSHSKKKGDVIEWKMKASLPDRASFFFCSKVKRSNRSEHPTEKPVALMRWLVRLITPLGGLVLDPYAGSGSTIVACAEEGLTGVGIEREPEYHAIAERRLAKALAQATAAE